MYISYHTLRLCSNFTSMSKYLSNNVWRDLKRLPTSASVMVTLKARSENQFFAENLPLQPFRATVANANTKVSPYMIWYVPGPHASEIWTKLYCPKCIKFELFHFFERHLLFDLVSFVILISLVILFLLSIYHYYHLYYRYHSEKWFTIFLPKSSKFWIFRTVRFFFQISPVCGPNTCQKMYK